MTDHSQVLNGFWFGASGFSPLLIAMGASAFAFSAAQKALVTEGFTDALLLPTLIREASEVDRLEYQVVPDFARAKADEVLNFDLLAARVAYVADGDQGGTDHVENKLKPNGILPEQIAFLGGEGSGTTLEDLVDPGVFLEVVNDHLKDHGADVDFPEEQLPSTGRMTALAEWCEAQSTPASVIDAPTKPDVAKALLAKRKRALVADDHRETLQQLDEQVRSILAKATVRLAEAR
jgi:predicted ATP-dependent endonuclease of OLD family